MDALAPCCIILAIDIAFIFRFCDRKGNEMFCRVPRAYVEDDFNLYGLHCRPNYSECRSLILDQGETGRLSDGLIYRRVCALYMLIHARYIVTPRGLGDMREKVIN